MRRCLSWVCGWRPRIHRHLNGGEVRLAPIIPVGIVMYGAIFNVVSHDVVHVVTPAKICKATFPKNIDVKNGSVCVEPARSILDLRNIGGRDSYGQGIRQALDPGGQRCGSRRVFGQIINELKMLGHWPFVDSGDSGDRHRTSGCLTENFDSRSYRDINRPISVRLSILGSGGDVGISSQLALFTVIGGPSLPSSEPSSESSTYGRNERKDLRPVGLFLIGLITFAVGYWRGGLGHWSIIIWAPLIFFGLFSAVIGLLWFLVGHPPLSFA